MQFRQFLWGSDAMDPECHLVVLESGACLPPAQTLGRHLRVLAAYAGETLSEFACRLQLKLKRHRMPTRTAFFCLNGESGWDTMLSRLRVARTIAPLVASSGGRLQVLLPTGASQGISFEIMALTDLLRREFPELAVAVQPHSSQAVLVARAGQEDSSGSSCGAAPTSAVRKARPAAQHEAEAESEASALDAGWAA